MPAPAIARAALTPQWVRNDLWRRARATPSLDLRFAESKSLGDAVSGRSLVTFTRASSATYVDSDGLIKTASNDIPRFQHDPTTGACLGLLVEEQRQNLLLNSATLSTQSVTSAATAYTLSFYGTGTITLSGTSTAGPLVGTASNQRVSLTFTPTAGTLTLTVSGSVTNANLEAGSFATSWIPTTGTSATRSADIATVSGTAFSGWYNQAQGTVFVSAPSAISGGRLAMFDDGTLNNRWELRIASGVAALNSWTAGVQDANAFSGASLGEPNTVNTVSAAAIALNNAAISTRGVTPGVDSAVATPPGINRLHIGSFQGTTTFTNGTISRLAYWPTRLPNATLQSLTA